MAEFGLLFVNIVPFSLFLHVDTFDVIPHMPLLLSFLFLLWATAVVSSAWPFACLLVVCIFSSLFSFSFFVCFVLGLVLEFYFHKFHTIVHFYPLIICHQISVSVWLMVPLSRSSVFTTDDFVCPSIQCLDFVFI